MKLLLWLYDEKAIHRLTDDHPEARDVLAKFVADNEVVVVELYTNSGKFRLLTAPEIETARRKEHEKMDEEIRKRS